MSGTFATERIPFNRTCRAIACEVGFVVRMIPSAQSSGYVEFSIGGDPYVAWPKGTKSTQTSDTLLVDADVRVVTLTGTVTLEIDSAPDAAPANTWASNVSGVVTPPDDAPFEPAPGVLTDGTRQLVYMVGVATPRLIDITPAVGDTVTVTYLDADTGTYLDSGYGPITTARTLELLLPATSLGFTRTAGTGTTSAFLIR